MAKKAKWLEEGTNVDLLEVITEALEETDNTTKINRGKKAVDELLERQPSAEASISDLLTEAKTLITEAQSIYEEEEAELIDMDEDVEEEVVEMDEEDEEVEDDLDSLSVKELRAIAKEQGIDIKGMKKADLIEALSEEVEEEEYGEEDDEELALEDMTLAELKEIADELEVDYPSKVRKPKLIALIEEAEEADDFEEEEVEDEEEEELEDYEDMTLADLKAEARERGIRISKKHKRDQVIALLEADDAE